jgi:hypothetical protein
MTLNVVEALVRIQERIHDRSGATFGEEELLRGVDDSLRRIFGMLRTHGDEGALDYLDVTVTSLTQLERGVLQYKIPETVTDPKYLELMRGDGSAPYPITHVPLEHKDLSRGLVTGKGITWNWGRRGSLEIRGTGSISWPTLRIWFARLIPPLFRATGSVASTTTSIVVQSPIGAFKARDDLYTGYQFEATAGANVGQVRRCSTHVGSTLTVDAFGASMASQTFAMLIPVADEHVEYVVDLATLKFLGREGSVKEKKLVQEELDQLMQSFESGIARRQSGEPPRFFSSRMVR